MGHRSANERNRNDKEIIRKTIPKNEENLQHEIRSRIYWRKRCFFFIKGLGEWIQVSGNPRKNSCYSEHHFEVEMSTMGFRFHLDIVNLFVKKRK